MLRVEEVIELNNNKKLKQMIFPKYQGIFIEQYNNENKGKYCASSWLGCIDSDFAFLADSCSDSDFAFLADSSLDYSNASRGVIFARDVKPKEKTK